MGLAVNRRHLQVQEKQESMGGLAEEDARMATIFDWENPRLCRGGSRSLTFTGVAPFCVFPYFSQKRYMHERRPYRTPDEFLVPPTPRLSAGLTTTAPTARATGCCLHGALLHRPL